MWVLHRHSFRTHIIIFFNDEPIGSFSPVQGASQVCLKNMCHFHDEPQHLVITLILVILTYNL